ncbi:MAG: hypothetical protein ACTHU0_16535 [Kofleriaceae bacterium]
MWLRALQIVGLALVAHQLATAIPHALAGSLRWTRTADRVLRDRAVAGSLGQPPSPPPTRPEVAR